MTLHGEDWEEEEIVKIVDIYAHLLLTKQASNKTRREIAVKRALEALPGRNEASVLMRMGNIGAVLDELGQPYITDWKPRRNVGPTNTGRIRRALDRHGLI